MTVEQQPVFTRISQHLACNHGVPFDQREGQYTSLTARAGRGKTWLMNLIVAHARSKGVVVLCVASTALASAQLRVPPFPGGRTAHSQFKIPVTEGQRDVRKVVECTMEDNDPQADFLRAVELLVWDEVLNSHADDISAVDRLLRRLCRNDRPFGGKTVLFGGDLRQIPPVVAGGTPYDVCNAVICERELWGAFVNIELQRPVRDADDPQYSSFVDSLGDGTAQEDQEVTDDQGQPLVQLPTYIRHTTDQEHIVHTVYPNLYELNQDPRKYTAHAILSTTNLAAKAFNDFIVDKMKPAGLRVMKSHDRLDGGGDGEDCIEAPSPHVDLLT